MAAGKPAFMGDLLVARTWVEPFKGATCERRTEIYRLSDKQILVTARSLWILLDPISRRPRRANESLQRLFEKHCNGQELAL